MFKRVGPLVAMGVLIVGLGWVLFWLVFSAHGPRDAWDRVRETGVLRIGYAVEAPYAFVAPSLEVTGESPETARLVANEIGVRHIEWVQVSFANLIPELLDGRFDLIAAGLFMTEDRLRQVSFSLPTLQVGPGVLMRADHEQELDAPLSWLLTSRGRIAVLEGAVVAGVQSGSPAAKAVAGGNGAHGGGCRGPGHGRRTGAVVANHAGGGCFHAWRRLEGGQAAAARCFGRRGGTGPGGLCLSSQAAAPAGGLGPGVAQGEGVYRPHRGVADLWV